MISFYKINKKLKRITFNYIKLFNIKKKKKIKSFFLQIVKYITLGR